MQDNSTPFTDPVPPALASLIGTWRGQGRGDFPTIEPFGFTEEVEFGATGKPVLSYKQRTRHDDGRPLHAESGWLRVVGNDDADGLLVEWVVAQPTGIVELASATLRGGVLDFTCQPQLTPTAVAVTTVRRRYELSGDQLTYDFWMATANVPNLTHHLRVEMGRVA